MILTHAVCVACSAEFSYPPRVGAPRRRCDECRVIYKPVADPEVKARKAAQARAYYHRIKNTPEYLEGRRVRTERAQARREAGDLPHWRQRNPELARECDQRRRAVNGGASNGTRVFAQQIYDRDGWICYLCERPVDPALKYPDAGSVSLDHVVPLSKGGAHDEANCRCSHLGCNMAKGSQIL